MNYDVVPQWSITQQEKEEMTNIYAAMWMNFKNTC